MAKKKCECVSAQWLLEALPELVDQQIVDADNAKRLEEFCRQKIALKKDNSGRHLLLALGCCCALLITLGMALILSHNWDQLSNATRLLLGNLPLAGGIAFGLTSLLKSKSSAWTESASIILIIGIGCSIAAVAQVYNLGGSVKDFLQLWLLLSLPLVWVLHSISAVLLGSILFVTWGAHACHPRDPAGPYWSLLWLLTTAGYLFHVLKVKNSGIRQAFARWLLVPILIYYPIFTGIFADHGTAGTVMLCLLTALLLYLGLWLRETNRPSAPLTVCGFLGLLVAGAIAAYPHTTTSTTVFVLTPEVWQWCNLPPALIFAAVMIFLAERAVMRRQFYWLLPVLLAAVLLLVPETWRCLGGSILLFSTGGILLFLSFHRQSLALLNGGAATIVVLAAEWFLSNDFPILWRGVGFITIGAVFGGLNLLFYKKFKAIKGGQA